MKSLSRLFCIFLLAGFAFKSVQAAGGFVDLPRNFDGNSNVITNPWWSITPGEVRVFIEEADDECIIGVLEIRTTANQYRTVVDGVAVRELWDREFVGPEDAECDGDLGDIGDWELLESTLDWYAEDVDGNVWYFGEHSVATDHDECDHETAGIDPILGIAGCLDGSWESGKNIWTGLDDEDILAGIAMLAEPEKGQFYFQEYWEDEATDMGKVLNFITIDTELEGEQEGCLVVKEWVPLSPGNIEHKFYCEGLGLMLVHGKSGGKTVFTNLVEIIEP